MNDKAIEEIIKKTECHNDFKCYRSNFKSLPKYSYSSAAKTIECHDKNNISCNYALNFGNVIFCQCPLLNYFVKNKNKSLV